MLLTREVSQQIGIEPDFLKIDNLQAAASYVLAPYIHGETAILLQELNSAGILAHNVFAEVTRRRIVGRIVEGLPEYIDVDLQPFNQARMLLHDISKIRLASTEAESAELFDPEGHNRAKPNTPGCQSETRDFETIMAYLKHPKLSYYMITMLYNSGLITQTEHEKESLGAVSHQERASYVPGKSYLRQGVEAVDTNKRQSRPSLSQTANDTLRLGDSISLVEERSYRPQKLARNIQEKILFATHPTALTLAMLQEIKLPPSVFSAREYRDLIITSSLSVLDMVDTIPRDTRISCLPPTTSKTLVSSLGDRLWQTYRVNIQKLDSSIMRRQNKYFSPDPLREINDETPKGYIPGVGYIQ